MDSLQTLRSDFRVHERVCELNQKTIISRLDRLEKIGLSATGVMIVGLFGIIVAIFFAPG